MPHKAQNSLCKTLQTARQSRRISQLELALRMGVSQRHVSFVETGRAQPSRSLLLAWLEELNAPLAQRNVALQQAGFASVYAGREMGDAVMAPAREALGKLLDAHDPMPAMVLDASWQALQFNRGARWLMLTLFDTPHGELAFFTMFSTSGTPQDITLASLRVEHWFAADALTRGVMVEQLSK